MTQKLHFTSLNYIPKYILHYKPFECTFYNINYDSCYTLHVNIKFFVNLDEKICHYMKKLNCSFFSIP